MRICAYVPRPAPSNRSNQWISMVDNFNQALKEIGDVENWAERIEADMHSISQGLEFVQGSGEMPESITL